MLVLNVVAFAGVAAHVVERQREFVPFGHLARASAVAGRECFVTAARMGEHEFVVSVAHGFQAVFPVVEQERRAWRGVRHALEQAADAYAVDLLRRERRARYAGFILVPKFGYVFVALGSPLAWIFADIFLIPAYIYVVKRLRRKFGQETPAMLKRCQKSLA